MRGEARTTHHGLERGAHEIPPIRGDHATADGAVERGGVVELVAAPAQRAHATTPIAVVLLPKTLVLLLQRLPLRTKLILEQRGIRQKILIPLPLTTNSKEDSIIHTTILHHVLEVLSEQSQRLVLAARGLGGHLAEVHFVENHTVIVDATLC